MAVVHATAASIEEAVMRSPGVEIAAVNAPKLCTISGPVDAIEAFGALSGFPTQPLRVSHAFHSAAMDGAVEPFADAFAAAAAAPPEIPVISNRSGDWHTPETATDAAGWGRHIREPVQFAGGLARVAEAGADVVWELGPHPALTALGPRNVEGQKIAWLSTLRRGRADQSEVHAALAAFYERGDVDWCGVHAGKVQRMVSIPTYPFARERYWVGSEGDGAPARGRGVSEHPLLGPIEFDRSGDDG